MVTPPFDVPTDQSQSSTGITTVTGATPGQLWGCFIVSETIRSHTHTHAHTRSHAHDTQTSLNAGNSQLKFWIDTDRHLHPRQTDTVVEMTDVMSSSLECVSNKEEGGGLIIIPPFRTLSHTPQGQLGFVISGSVRRQRDRGWLLDPALNPLSPTDISTI